MSLEISDYFLDPGIKSGFNHIQDILGQIGSRRNICKQVNKPNGTLTGMKNIHLYTHSNTHIHRYIQVFSVYGHVIRNPNRSRQHKLFC